jgi:hypothetical protein
MAFVALPADIRADLAARHPELSSGTSEVTAAA